MILRKKVSAKNQMFTGKRKQMVQCAHFEPILESITKFLVFKDCSHVDQLNHMFHFKTWKYVLTAVHRSSNCNSVIKLTCDSILWVSKYRLFLKHLELEILEETYNNAPAFDLSSISHLQGLVIYNVSLKKFPLQMNHLICYDITGNIPNLLNTNTIYLYQSLIICSSQSVQNLFTCSFDSMDCETLPEFPHLNHLEVSCKFLLNPSRILEKYPNLISLHISCDNINFVAAIRLFKHYLVIKSWPLVDITSFSLLECCELNLIGCPNIQDYSSVSHIPIVKKK
jgi:hypothetical protein